MTFFGVKDLPTTHHKTQCFERDAHMKSVVRLKMNNNLVTASSKFGKSTITALAESIEEIYKFL